MFSILQETKFKEAAGFYEAIVKKNFDNVSFAAVYIYCMTAINVL